MMIDIITIGFIVTPMGFIPILILSLLKGIDENEGDIPNFLRFIAVWILIIIFVVGVIRMCEDSKSQDYTLEETCIEYETIQHREFADEKGAICQSPANCTCPCGGGCVCDMHCEEPTPTDIIFWNETKCIKWEAKLIREANK
jgi:hypothetical protein